MEVGKRYTQTTHQAWIWSTIQVLDGYPHCSIYIQEASIFFAGSCSGQCGLHGIWQIHPFFSYVNMAKGNILAMLLGNKDKDN
jgi:hypothetical protein